METFVVYLIKTTVCLIIFSVFFRLLLMKETFFRFTRMTLLLGLVGCSVLPLVELKIDKSYFFQQPIYQLEEIFLTDKVFNEQRITEAQNINIEQDIQPEAVVLEATDIAKTNKSFPWFSVLIVIYWLGFGAMLFRFIASLIRLRQLIGVSRIIKSENYRLVISREEVLPLSFFRYIVCCRKKIIKKTLMKLFCTKKCTSAKNTTSMLSSRNFFLPCIGLTRWCGCCVAICAKFTNTKPTML